MLCQANDVIGHILLRVYTANTGSNPVLTTVMVFCGKQWGVPAAPNKEYGEAVRL